MLKTEERITVIVTDEERYYYLFMPKQTRVICICLSCINAGAHQAGKIKKPLDKLAIDNYNGRQLAEANKLYALW